MITTTTYNCIFDKQKEIFLTYLSCLSSIFKLIDICFLVLDLFLQTFNNVDKRTLVCAHIFHYICIILYLSLFYK